MAIVGRAIGEQMRADARETPSLATWRAQDRAAGERAHAEALERFGPVTAENAQAFSDWQEARRRELLA